MQIKKQCIKKAIFYINFLLNFKNKKTFPKNKNLARLKTKNEKLLSPNPKGNDCIYLSF